MVEAGRLLWRAAVGWVLNRAVITQLAGNPLLLQPEELDPVFFT